MGFEPTSYSLWDCAGTNLQSTPQFFSEPARGFEPPTHWLQVSSSTIWATLAFAVIAGVKPALRFQGVHAFSRIGIPTVCGVFYKQHFTILQDGYITILFFKELWLPWGLNSQPRLFQSHALPLELDSQFFSDRTRTCIYAFAGHKFCQLNYRLLDNPSARYYLRNKTRQPVRLHLII